MTGTRPGLSKYNQVGPCEIDIDNGSILTSTGDNHEYLLEYHCRFTRFYISSYAVRSLRKSDEELSPLQQVQIKRCVAYVIALLEWPLRMSPIQQDRLQYIPGSSTTMATFSALFLLSTCQHFTSIVTDVDESLDVVMKIGHMMVRLSVDEMHRPHINGTLLLKNVESVRAVLDARKKVAVSKGNDARPPVVSENSAGSVYNDAGQEWPKDMDFGAHLASMEPFW